MWKLTEVEDACPVIVLGVAFAGITCLRSKNAVEFAGIATPDKIATVSRLTVAVTALEVVFAIAMLVTIVDVVVLGTV
jgi:hypothetical protein